MWGRVVRGAGNGLFEPDVAPLSTIRGCSVGEYRNAVSKFVGTKIELPMLPSMELGEPGARVMVRLIILADEGLENLVPWTGRPEPPYRSTGISRTLSSGRYRFCPQTPSRDRRRKSTGGN